LDLAGQKGPEITLEGVLIVVKACFTAEGNGSGSAGLTKRRCTWLLSFYTCPANCLLFYSLSSMMFTAAVCQVYVSGSVGTEVFVVVQTLIGHENYHDGKCPIILLSFMLSGYGFGSLRRAILRRDVLSQI